MELEKGKTNREVAQLFGVPVMESLKDDLEMIKEKFHENYGITAEELVDIDFDMFLDMSISTMKKNPMMKSNQLIIFRP